MIDRWRYVLLTILITGLIPQTVLAADRPNVVLIMVDDI